MIRPFAALLLLGCAVSAQKAPNPPESAGPKLSETLGTAELLLLKEPAVIPNPFDFGQLARPKLPIFSLEGMSWTTSRFRIEGMEATDPFQPGRPVTFPDPQGVAEVSIDRESWGQAPTLNYTFRNPEPSWHGSGSAFLTGGSLFGDNLPPLDRRGSLMTSDKFNRFVHSNVELGGRLTSWADFYFSGTGRWDKQTAPEENDNRGVGSYDLNTTIRANLHPGSKNRFDFLIVGARHNSSAWAIPIGLETLNGRRIEPPILPQRGLREEDHLDFVQFGWRREFLKGELQLRYGYTTTHADTLATDDSLEPTYLGIVLAGHEVAYSELTNGAVHGGPLLQTQAVKPQQTGLATWRAPDLRHGSVTHSITLTGSLDRSLPANRYSNPPNVLALTADGLPVSGTLLFTPRHVKNDLFQTEFGADDRIRLSARVTIDAGFSFSSANGSLPDQGPPTDGRSFQFDARRNVIAWRSIAPHAGITWQSPGANPVVIRAGYGRFYESLSARDLDFANPNSLSGLEYRWDDGNHDGIFEYYEAADVLLRRYGGAYSEIDPHLKRPHVDEFSATAEWKLPAGFFARVRAFRRTERDRLAAVNIGVPFSAYTARQIVDPGADGRVGTTDDRVLTVFDQNPSTFGQDWYRLTNPGLRMDQKGVVMEGGFSRASVSVQGSLYLGKSWGLTNPGNEFWENDSGVVGSLYGDPNTLIFANGRPAIDPGFAAKVWTSFPTPRRWGKLEILSSAIFVGGYPYARRLLVTGLSQGPVIVDATPRGTSDGSRTDPVFDWNLRIARSFKMPRGSLRVSGELFNVLNLGTTLRAEDLTGPTFQNQLPLQIQPPRFLRAAISWAF